MINDRRFTGILMRAMVRMFELEHRSIGDRFATEQEMERITSEPMEHSALLQGLDANRFLGYILDAQYESEQAQGIVTSVLQSIF